MGHDHALAAITSPDAYQADLSFDEYLLGRGLSPKTLSNYLRELRLAANWFDENGVDINTALPSQLVAYADTRPNTPSVRGHLRSALRYWWDWRGVKGWPEAIKLPSVPTMTCKALEDDQARLMFAKAREIGWRAGTAVEVMLSLALRNEECATMRWDGFSDDMATYTLVGKNNKQRALDVAPELAASLDRQRNGSVYVFEGRGGGHVSHQTICNWVKKVAAASGITERVYPHRMRHTSLATMNDETKDLRTTQEFAGHSRPETTAGYTRTTRKRMHGAAVGLYQRLAAETWLHSTVADGRPHTFVGTGDMGPFRADCDPPGEDGARPFCWQGPDRFTLDEAIADARAHAPGVEPKILNTSWPDSDPLEHCKAARGGLPLTSVTALYPDATGSASDERRGKDHQEDDQHWDERDDHQQTDDETETGTHLDEYDAEADNAIAAEVAAYEPAKHEVIDVWARSEGIADAIRQVKTRPEARPLNSRPAPKAAPAMSDRTAALLSRRESEVLQLLATGISTTEGLAHRLGIAPKTVKNHLSSIFKKLSVHDRTQVVVEALRLGLVDPKMQEGIL